MSLVEWLHKCVEAQIELNRYWYKYRRNSVDVDEGDCVLNRS